ncbi:MAG: galactokinase [Planctomycetes bacterium]|nr:galactokinase [Planctomycetota bacterium]
MSETRREELERALLEHRTGFEQRFGSGAGVRLWFSPGRVNLMGAHLDYNGGPVMPTAIDRGTFFALRPRSDHRVRFASTLEPGEFEAALADLPGQPARRWWDYPVGVLRELLAGTELPDVAGFDLLFGGNLPVGAGLSSSASICVGTALAISDTWELGLERLALVQAALAAERGYVGVQCGIMDPYSVGLARSGTLLWLDCKDRSSAWMPLDDRSYAIAVADTLVRRELAQGAFNERVRQCAQAFAELAPHQPGATCLRDIELATLEAQRAQLDPLLASRAEHVVREVGRTFAARDALERGDLPCFGEQMTRAHASLREHFEVSVPELDTLVDSATACAGVLGSRLTGAGFGGCVVVLLRRGAEDELRERLERDFLARFGRAPVVEFFGGDEGPREIRP